MEWSNPFCHFNQRPHFFVISTEVERQRNGAEKSIIYELQQRVKIKKWLNSSCKLNLAILHDVVVLTLFCYR